MFKITAKNAQYNGVTAGVKFTNGVAEVADLDQHTSDILTELGYEVEGERDTEDTNGMDINEMTVAQLKELAKQTGIDLKGASKRDDIITVVNAALEAKAGEAGTGDQAGENGSEQGSDGSGE